ncbi:uncharacterized protein IL334_005821 [Kwoniella shivajii]|uniref:F-box domain-containing protein n=1 Tax=Kwoniella shivajii TaxID=564305 RepID=A0ABZ1D627_9TREE|nr:hypothetical protein IL334_005821 [Kwoniella shivajii]
MTSHDNSPIVSDPLDLLSSPNSFPMSDPQTPTMPSRERSDTILTTSSSDSFPQLQTPQTPSILGMLNQTSSKQGTHSTNDDLTSNRNRNDSFGFGGPLNVNSPESIPQTLSSLNVPTHHLEPSHHTTTPVADHERISPLPSDSHTAGNLIVLNSSTTPISTSSEPSPRVSTSTIGTFDNSDTPSGTRQSKLKEVVRRKLQRSKSSLRNIGKSKTQEEDEEPIAANHAASLAVSGHTPASSVDRDHVVRPKTSRLKRLLTLSRKPSSVSIKASLPSNGVSTAQVEMNRIPHPVVDTQTYCQNNLRHHEITVRDFAHSPPMQMPSLTHNRHISVGQLPQFPSDLYNGTGEIARRLPIHAGEMAEEVDPHSLRPARISRPRATSMPLLDTLSDHPPTGELENSSDRQSNYFDTVLPRELQLQIIKTLLESWKGENQERRWTGEVYARKELIKLSRLCFDGQLWSSLDLTPFSYVLHPSTLQKVIVSSLPFITALTLRGMDNLLGSMLLPSLSPFDWSPSPRSNSLAVWLPNLRVLDLRGATSLTVSDICSIIRGSPGLKIINLKAVQNCSSEVVRTIARSTRQLESLDISRCKDLTLGDLIVMMNAMDQAQRAKLKVLRLAGMKSYGRHASDFLPLLAEKLVNLEVLDVQGCTRIFDEDFENFSRVLTENERESKITHLNLSGCTSLQGQFMYHLSGSLPNLRMLELANLQHIYKDNDSDESGLIRLLKTTPKIERLDLDQTGLHGGVTDSVLDVLSRGRTDDGNCIRKNLVELRIGFAKGVTSEGLVRLIRNCPKLKVLEIDNTPADTSVLRAFMKVHPSDGAISVIDCRSVNPTELDKLIPSTRSRVGWKGWTAVPFSYQPKEMDERRTVIKSFQSWKDVNTPKSWREIRADTDEGNPNQEVEEGTNDSGSTQDEDGLMENIRSSAGCIIM